MVKKLNILNEVFLHFSVKKTGEKNTIFFAFLLGYTIPIGLCESPE